MPPVVATLEETPAGVLLRAGTDDLDWMARFLVNLDLPLVVRRPPELREALRRLAARVADLATVPRPPALTPAGVPEPSRYPPRCSSSRRRRRARSSCTPTVLASCPVRCPISA